MSEHTNNLNSKLMGIHNNKQLMVYMRKDFHICLSEGFDTRVRLKIRFQL